MSRMALVNRYRPVPVVVWLATALLAASVAWRLIESRRRGKSVQHRATQLGHALLEGSAPALSAPA